MALEIKDLIRDIGHADNDKIKAKIGLHCGSVVAGIIGEQKFSYDLWGDTVNTASRMESTCLDDKIQCTRDFASKIAGLGFKLIERGEIEIKGKGKMRTYFLSE